MNNDLVHLDVFRSPDKVSRIILIQQEIAELTGLLSQFKVDMSEDLIRAETNGRAAVYVQESLREKQEELRMILECATNAESCTSETLPDAPRGGQDPHTPTS